MTKQRYVPMAALFLMASAALHGQATESTINKEIGGLRGVSDAQRPAATTTIANEIRTLPAGMPKLKLADALIHLVTEGDPGRDTLQAVADALAQALKRPHSRRRRTAARRCRIWTWPNWHDTRRHRRT